MWQAGLQSLGLLLDIVGVVLLFKYGLPEFSPSGGVDSLAIGPSAPEEICKEKKYRKMGKMGLVLIVSGFVLQLIPNATDFIWELK